ARGPHLPRDQPEERRLAGAVGADDRAQLAAADADVDAINGEEAAERTRQLLCAEQGVVRHGEEGMPSAWRPSRPGNEGCCCNMKMSSPNCAVKRSSLNGDLHVEPERGASAGAIEGAVQRAADECAGGRRPPDHRAAGPTAEASVRGRWPQRA